MIFREEKWQWAMLSRYVKLRNGDKVYVKSFDRDRTRDLFFWGFNSIAFKTACGKIIFANTGDDFDPDDFDIVGLL